MWILEVIIGLADLLRHWRFCIFALPAVALCCWAAFHIQNDGVMWILIVVVMGISTLLGYLFETRGRARRLD
jgi:hypothetical protein